MSSGGKWVGVEISKELAEALKSDEAMRALEAQINAEFWREWAKRFDRWLEDGGWNSR